MNDRIVRVNQVVRHRHRQAQVAHRLAQVARHRLAQVVHRRHRLAQVVHHRHHLAQTARHHLAQAARHLAQVARHRHRHHHRHRLAHHPAHRRQADMSQIVILVVGHQMRCTAARARTVLPNGVHRPVQKSVPHLDRERLRVTTRRFGGVASCTQIRALIDVDVAAKFRYSRTAVWVRIVRRLRQHTR
jgi:hypothetical protein